MNDLPRAISEAASQVGKTISSSLSATDRQRINSTGTTILYHGNLTTTSWVLLYTATTGGYTEITEINAANLNADNTVLFAVTPPATAASNDHIIEPGMIVLLNKKTVEHPKTVLLGDWSLYGKLSIAASLNLHISGLERMN